MICGLWAGGVDGALTNNGSFAIHRLGQASERVQLQSVDEVLRVLREEFGIRVPEHPELRGIIERLIAGRNMTPERLQFFENYARDTLAGVVFSTVNDALGVNPDWQVAQGAPPEVREAVTYGRAVAVQG